MPYPNAKVGDMVIFYGHDEGREGCGDSYYPAVVLHLDNPNPAMSPALHLYIFSDLTPPTVWCLHDIQYSFAHTCNTWCWQIDVPANPVNAS